MRLIDALAVLGPLGVFPLARPIVGDGASLPRARYTWPAAALFACAFLAAARGCAHSSS